MNSPLQIALIGAPPSLSLEHLRGPLERLNLSVRSVMLTTPELVSDQILEAQSHAAQIQSALCDTPADIVLTTQPALVAELETSLPVVLWTDGPCTAGRDNKTEEGIATYRLERFAVTRASLLVYSSPWAAEIAMQYFGADPARVRVLPFGGHPGLAPGAERVPQLLAARPAGVCRLLWYGADWDRRGGAVSLETLQELLARGFDATLTVIGNAMRGAPLHHPRLVHLGAFNPHSVTARAVIAQLLMESHYLLLPSPREHTPAAIAEASAFALPTLAPDVGGVAGLLWDGMNGFLMPPGASAAVYAQRIASNLENPRTYEALALSARHQYETHLSGSAIAHRLKAMLLEAVRAGRGSRQSTPLGSWKRCAAGASGASARAAEPTTQPRAFTAATPVI